MAVNAAYIGAGTTLSSSYYMRNFYIAARHARTTSGRREMSGNELAQADSAALKRAVKSLQRSDFSEAQDEDIRNKAMAYVETYNNLLSSASSSSDDQIKRAAKLMKSATQQYASELDRIGITVNANGTLESREARITSASLSKFEKLFSSDSAYMQQMITYSRKVERQSDALIAADAQKRAAATKKIQGTASSDTGTQPDTSSAPAATTAAAQIVSADMDLDTLINTGIGNRINLIL